MKLCCLGKLCDVAFHALLQGMSGCWREQHYGSGLNCPGDVRYPNFLCGKPTYFDATVCNPLQDSLLNQSAVTAGVAASWGKVQKDAHYEKAVVGAEEIFIPLAVGLLACKLHFLMHILNNVRLMNQPYSLFC